MVRIDGCWPYDGGAMEFLSKVRTRVARVSIALKQAVARGRLERLEFRVADVPVRYDVDVAVVGAGVSGIAAAVAAGRSGVRTLLIERQGAVGGLLTLGLVTPFSMQMLLPDGAQVTKGLVSELLDRLSERDGTIQGWRDWKVPKVPVEPEVFKLVAYEMLMEAGVKVLLNTSFVDADVDENRIGYVFLHNKGGICAAKATMFVDTTGEADLARAAGVPTTLNADVDPSVVGVVSEAMRNRGWVSRTEKTSSLQFLIGNVDLDQTHDFIVAHPEVYASTKRGELVEDGELFSYLWREKGFFYLPHQTSFKELIQQAAASGEFRPKIGRYHVIEDSGIGIDGLRQSNTVVVNANRVMLNPFDDEDVTYALIQGQEVCFEIWRFLRDHIPGFERSTVMAVAPYMGIRRGAQIVGDQVFTAEDRMSFVQRTDTIGMAARKTSQAYDVPFSLMLPKRVDNLLVASGKTVSTDDFLPYRVKPVCMILGEAAGTAAALCSVQGTTPRELDVRQLQQELVDRGVHLGDEARLNELGVANASRGTSRRGSSPK